MHEQVIDKAIRKYARGYSADQRQDLRQMCLLKLIATSQYENPEIKTIYEIVKNAVIDLVDTANVRKRYEVALDDAEESDFAYVKPPPDLDLHQALDKLSPTLKRIIVLKYYYGYVDSEIAPILNWPLRTVERYSALALIELRKGMTDGTQDD